MPLCEPAAGDGPQDLGNAPLSSVFAPAVDSFPAPVPPQRTANHLGSPERKEVLEMNK